MSKSFHKKFKSEFLFKGKEARKQKVLQLNKLQERKVNNVTNKN